VRYKWKTLAAVAFGTYVATMDMSIVNIALPTLSCEFNVSPDTIIWATLISSLVATGLTLTAGRAGDLFGRKRVYVLGWVIFTTGMAVAAFVQSIEQLIAARAFQSIGSAMAIGNSNAIVAEGFPDAERGRALGTTGAVVGAGLMSGPILGGLILDVFDWRAIFYLRIPIGLIAMMLALVIVREQGRRSSDRHFDLFGAVTLFVALAATLLAVNRGQSWGWSSPQVLGLLATGALSLAAFIAIEARDASPIISLALFRIRTFAASVLCLILNFLGQAAVTFLMPFYLIQVRGYSTAQAGLVIGILPAMMLALSSYSGYLSDRYRFRYQVPIGLACCSLGLLSLATLQPETPMTLIMLRLALVGVGSAIFMSPNSSMIMSSVPRSRFGTASASVATARNIGNAAGLALAGTVLVSVASAAAGISGVRADQLPSQALLDGIHAGFLVGAGISCFAILAALLSHDASRPAEHAPATVDRQPVRTSSR